MNYFWLVRVPFATSFIGHGAGKLLMPAASAEMLELPMLPAVLVGVPVTVDRRGPLSIIRPGPASLRKLPLPAIGMSGSSKATRRGARLTPKTYQVAWRMGTERPCREF